MSQVQEHSPAKSLKTFPEGIDIAPLTLLQSLLIYVRACVHLARQSLWLQNCFLLWFLCRWIFLGANDKMRLTLNLKDDALHPSGHPLVLFLCYRNDADKQKWLYSVSTWCDCSPANVCGNRWTMLPWEINSISVNTDDWNGYCEVGLCMVEMTASAWVSVWIFNVSLHVSVSFPFFSDDH